MVTNRLKTPQGRKSLLDDDAYALVHEETFKTLFGDWQAAMLIRQARHALSKPDSAFRFDFIPSERLSKGFFNLLGHNVSHVTITDSDIRHIINKHGKDESSRGQENLSPEDIGVIPYVMNSFDDMFSDTVWAYGRERSGITFIKRVNGTTFVGSIENGQDGSLVVTSWKKRRSGAPMPDMRDNPMAPELNVRDDSDSVAKVKKDIERIKSSADKSFFIINEVGEPDVRFSVPMEEILRMVRLGATKMEASLLLRDGRVPMNSRAKENAKIPSDVLARFEVQDGHIVFTTKVTKRQSIEVDSGLGQSKEKAIDKSISESVSKPSGNKNRGPHL